eukprot:TRINITY_DN19983_c0_g1_i1.p1 TRINITY_DN19983_c0_g1~~TRINITY_DN19983_c0_g1_i1.p1  ORF type:complete len:134 (-),score=42.82 TRINITY_DN19983_c0_g1_i1:30-431(-)
MSSWQKAKEYLESEWKPQKVIKGLPGKSKPNALIKERFSGFNSELKQLFETQQFFLIADEGLRKKMRENIRDFILPSYTAMVEKYKDVNFTKRVDDYIKYTPQTLEEIITMEFFEGRSKSKNKFQSALEKLKI